MKKSWHTSTSANVQVKFTFIYLVNTSVDKAIEKHCCYYEIPVSGNEWMSFKVADLEPTYITYMSKGQIDPSYNKGYTEAELEEYKHKWVNQKSAVKLTEDDKIIEGWINITSTTCVWKTQRNST